MTGWRSRAVCRPGSGVDADLFFPVSTAARDQIAAARAVCAACPARSDCLDDAIDTRDVEFGIRAGLMPDERRKLAAPRLRARAAEQVRRAADGLGVPPLALRAVDAADERGVLPAMLRWDTKRALLRAGLAEERVRTRGRGAGSAVRLNDVGMALRAQRRREASEGTGGCGDPAGASGGAEGASGGQREGAQCVRSAAGAR